MKKVFSYDSLFWMLVFFLVFLFVITQEINLPYVGPYAFNFNVYSLIAHNYNQFGMLAVKFAQISSPYEKSPLHPEYYLHHPPLISIIESFLFKLFGEYWWVGRLTVILFACGSAILIYFIALMLENRKYAFFVFSVYSIIPASSIFGRMIGQEPLVLFFALLTLLLSLLYVKTNKTFYIPFILLAIVLGVLSDWPMVYFVLSLAPYFIYKKKYKLFSLMVLSAFLPALGFLIYIYVFMNGFQNIINAFVNRSVSWQVHPYYLWPLLWPSAIFVRFFVYFNPIFATFTFIFVFQLLKKLHQRHFSSQLLILVGLFFFGTIHVLLYPSGSFGHIYWIYYFIPFVCFASASVLMRLKKKALILSAIFIISFLFLLGIDKWKTGEVKGNMWRYDLDQQVDKYLSPYENVYINKGSSLDGDVFKYKFHHNTYIASPYKLSHTYKHYIYSCDTTCNINDKDLKSLLSRYAYNKIQSTQGKGYVFQLDKRKKNGRVQETKEVKKPKMAHSATEEQGSIFRRMYIFLVTILQVPFL